MQTKFYVRFLFCFERTALPYFILTFHTFSLTDEKASPVHIHTFACIRVLRMHRFAAAEERVEEPLSFGHFFLFVASSLLTPTGSHVLRVLASPSHIPVFVDRKLLVCRCKCASASEWKVPASSVLCCLSIRLCLLFSVRAVHWSAVPVVFLSSPLFATLSIQYYSVYNCNYNYHHVG